MVPLSKVTCLLLLGIILFSSCASLVAAKSFIESCNTASQCTSMVGYRAPSTQKLQDIAALFNVDTVSLLGANNLDLTVADPENLLIEAHQVVKVPVSCSCVDGIWRGNSTVYMVKPGDTLSGIAGVLFGNLVTYKQIALANAISNPNNISVGAMLVIPFPCGCNNPVNINQPSILLSYVVESGDTVDKIVMDYGAASKDFMALNNINNASELIAGDVVAIPIHACTSTFRRSALDFGLLVANEAYLITAGHCVQCSCLPNLEQVYCTPAPATISGSCPDMRCLGTNLTIGGMTTAASVEGCNVTSCLYTGFKKRIILSSLQTVSLNTCPAPPPAPMYRSSSGTLAFPPAPAPSLPGLTPGTITSTQSAFAPAPSAATRLAAASQCQGLFSAALLMLCLLVLS